jgi:hypothetical protein
MTMMRGECNQAKPFPTRAADMPHCSRGAIVRPDLCGLRRLTTPAHRHFSPGRDGNEALRVWWAAWSDCSLARSPVLWQPAGTVAVRAVATASSARARRPDWRHDRHSGARFRAVVPYAPALGAGCPDHACSARCIGTVIAPPAKAGGLSGNGTGNHHERERPPGRTSICRRSRRTGAACATTPVRATRCFVCGSATSMGTRELSGVIGIF